MKDAVKTVIPGRTLLESGDLPFGDLVLFAAREGRRPRPIYQIHKWFARRLGCSFRSLLVSAVETEAANFWKAYYETANLSGLTVLDPFVGGGTSVVEAARLGATVIGVDIDPIACAVTEAELVAADLEDLLPTMEALHESVGKALASLYKTRGTNGQPLTVVHYFWVQIVMCPKCGMKGEAHPSFLLADEAQKEKWAFCRKCHEIHKLRRDQRRFMCKTCETETNLDDVPVDGGAYTCPSCSHRVPLISIGRESGTPPSWWLFAIEATTRTSGRSVPLKERVYLRATAADRSRYTRARKKLKKEIDANSEFLPDHCIVAKGRSDSRLTDYGYRRWTDLFNERQLLHLGLLARELKQLPDSQRRALGLAFSNHLTTNCMLTSYASGWRRLTPLFSIRAFRHIPRPVEVNPWSEGTGRGTFPNSVRQLIRASSFAISPKEPTIEGGFRPVPSITPHVSPRIFTGNACDLTVVDSESIDIVLTDPPYYDNVAYSELSEFFQPWLEHLGLVIGVKERRKSVKKALSARRNDEQSVEEFSKNLGEAFIEMHRVLKPGGLLAFTFRHSTSNAWLALGKALSLCGLKPIQVLPIPGEAGTGLHNHDGTSLWDAVLVFRKLPASVPARGLSDSQIESARVDVLAWRNRLIKQHHLPFNDADFINLFRATLVAASLGLYGPGSRQDIAIRIALEDASVI